MVNYQNLKAGDKLRIVGLGAPGFGQVGDVVTVRRCNGRDRVDVVHDISGEECYFALTCGASRLELVTSAADVAPIETVASA